MSEADVIGMRLSLTFTHLMQALDLLIESRRAGGEATPSDRATVWPASRAHKYALSSILHSFAGLESQLNAVGESLFWRSDDPLYISPEQRSFELSKLVGHWKSGMPIVEKVQFVMSRGPSALPPALLNALREVNKLRNMLVHGESFSVTLLVERDQNNRHGSGVVHAREDEERWQQAFPIMKFPAPDRITYMDARAVAKVLLEVVHHVGVVGRHPVVLVWEDPSHKMLTLGLPTSDVLAIGSIP